MVETLWDKITQFVSPEAGQARSRALNESIGYYIPPEMRGLLGLVADATPSAAYGRAAQASQEMVAPGRTPMQRIGSAGEMLSSTAEIAAPMAVAGRAGMPVAQAVQEGLLGFSAGADDMGRRFVERINQPGPVPTMYSNPIMRAPDDGIEAALRAKYPDAKINISGDAQGGYTLSRIELPKNMRSSGIGSSIMQDFVSMADAQGARINLSPSKDFGGSVPRLKDFYKRFGFVENKGRNKDFSTRETMYRESAPQPPAPSLPAPRNEAEAMARQVLEMRAAGRAGDVTEEMRAAADPQYMFANTPLPMDEASRMARREAMYSKDRYHGSNMDFTGFSGNVFTSDNPTVASTYNRGMLDAQIYPVVTREGPMGNVTVEGAGSNWNQLSPEMINDPAVARESALYPNESTGMLSTKGIERAAAFEGRSGVTFKDINDLGVGFNSQQFKGLGYTPEQEAALRQQYLTELSVPSEVDVRLSPNLVRSRFALFDPEFAHLRNLSAGVGGLGLLGLVGAQPGEQY
jgi:hypothetical protein